MKDQIKARKVIQSWDYMEFDITLVELELINGDTVRECEIFEDEILIHETKSDFGSDFAAIGYAFNWIQDYIKD